MRALNAELFPICRSITGDCPRRMTKIQRRRVSLEVHDTSPRASTASRCRWNGGVFPCPTPGGHVGSVGVQRTGNPRFGVSGGEFGIRRASVRLSELAKKVGVRRFVFASSCSNYSQAGDAMIDESGDLNPVTAFGESKVMSERDISLLADDKFRPVSLRPATAYGVSPLMRFDIVLNNLVAWAFKKGKIYLKSDGTPWRPIVHNEDTSRAFIAALEAPANEVWNEALNVGQIYHNYRIRDLAEIVAEVVPGCRIEFPADAGPDRCSYRVSIEKIRHRLPHSILAGTRVGSRATLQNLPVVRHDIGGVRGAPIPAHRPHQEAVGRRNPPF